jgi:hypothetical protein
MEATDWFGCLANPESMPEVINLEARPPAPFLGSARSVVISTINDMDSHGSGLVHLDEDLPIHPANTIENRVLRI